MTSRKLCRDAHSPVDKRNQGINLVVLNHFSEMCEYGRIGPAQAFHNFVLSAKRTQPVELIAYYPQLDASLLRGLLKKSRHSHTLGAAKKKECNPSLP